MKAYEIGKVLEKNESLGLEVVEAYNRTENLNAIVKVYTKRSILDLDPLLKAAVRKARLFVPREGVLYDVIITKDKRYGEEFKVNWILEKREGSIEPFLVSSDDSDPLLPPGLDMCYIGAKIYAQAGKRLEIYAGTMRKSNEPVVIKIYRRPRVSDINEIIKEAIVQARVEHRNNTKLYDISIQRLGGWLEIALVMEKLDCDLQEVIDKTAEPYSEEAFVGCFAQVAAGLLHAKFRVTST